MEAFVVADDPAAQLGAPHLPRLGNLFVALRMVDVTHSPPGKNQPTGEIRIFRE